MRIKPCTVEYQWVSMCRSNVFSVGLQREGVFVRVCVCGSTQSEPVMCNGCVLRVNHSCCWKSIKLLNVCQDQYQ